MSFLMKWVHTAGPGRTATVCSEKRLFNHLEEHSAFTYCPLGKQDGGLPAVSLGDGVDMTGRWV